MKTKLDNFNAKFINELDRQHEKEQLLDVLDALDKQEHSKALYNTLNVIANLMNELENRPSHARYVREFHHGKLVLTVKFNGMK